jgi:catechol 2,3-dioxygenase-like lactoylglutathione lyase family enzyme
MTILGVMIEGMMKKITPEMLVEDMERSLAFYTEVLHFEVVVKFPDEAPVFAQLKNGEVELMLYLRAEFEKEIPKFGSMPMDGTVALYRKLMRWGVGMRSCRST